MLRLWQAITNWVQPLISHTMPYHNSWQINKSYKQENSLFNRWRYDPEQSAAFITNYAKPAAALLHILNHKHSLVSTVYTMRYKFQHNFCFKLQHNYKNHETMRWKSMWNYFDSIIKQYVRCFTSWSMMCRHNHIGTTMDLLRINFA